MNNSDYDASFIAETLPAFVSEATEQTDLFEQLLLQLEDDPDGGEMLDALFRCAHTVKGSAGIFGLERLVDFTHHVESLLDRLREGELTLTAELNTLLLQSNDEIRWLVNSAAAAGDAQDANAQSRAELVRRLQAAGAAARAPSLNPAGPGSAGTEEPAPAVAAVCSVSRRWHVSAHFGAATFRDGMDPLAILNYVRRMGTVPGIACDVEAIPPLGALDPENCHLAYEFSLDTVATRAEIEAAFSFVGEDCRLQLFEPQANALEFADLIASMPDNPRLGDILIAAGAITPLQLEQALKSQSQAAAGGNATLIGRVLQEQAGVDATVIDAAVQRQQRQRGASAAPAEDNRFIRVQASRLDAVINLLGELVIASAGASLLARQSRQRKQVEANAQVGRLVEEIRNGTLQLRMVPIGETFARFRRVVRDTAAELGKDAALEISGGETELDKSVVERIADPLMHLVRNALDHGLEPAAERLAGGKPAQGRLTLSACHESGSILIRIADDGRGIQRDKVLRTAWERGLVERGVVPTDAEIDRLIFEAGFSTAEKVTNLSGRGVGMDVVRRNIEALRGSITIESVEGKGSCIEIRLPLTLAIIDGFLVGVGSSKFIFPLDSVVEVIEARGDPARCDARGRRCVELRGHVLPVVDLRCLYGLDGPAPARVSTVVIRASGQRYGVVVDALLGQHQTVIKPLSRMFRSLRGISGSSILGNGEVALIVDVSTLGDLAAAAPSGKTHRIGEPS